MARIALISTSLKVVSIAVPFFASTNRFAIVLRRLLIFSLRCSRADKTWFSNGIRPGCSKALSTSSFTILPCGPVAFT